MHVPPKLLYEGRSDVGSDELHYYAANRISSACECFAGICGYWRHHMEPASPILGIRLPQQKIVLTFGPANALTKTIFQTVLKVVPVARGTFPMISWFYSGFTSGIPLILSQRPMTPIQMFASGHASQIKKTVRDMHYEFGSSQESSMIPLVTVL
jgi:hypothetical protein